MEMTPYDQTGRRKLSRFHAEELLFEYCSGHLDPIRQRLVHEAMLTDPELAAEVQKIRSAIDYCGELSHWPISVKEIEDLKVANQTGLEVIFERTKIQSWPTGLRLAVESLLVVSAVFVVGLMMPWNAIIGFMQPEKGLLTLSEVRREMGVVAGETQLASSEKREIVYVDEGVSETEVERLARPAIESLGIVPRLNPPAAPGPLKPEVADLAITKVVPRLETTNPKPLASPQIQATPEEKATATAKGIGLLYRGDFAVTNVEANSPKLVSFIAELGGRKAGDVPLGWNNGKGAYFHFTLPEAKLAELERFLGEYGSLNLTKETHTRVMPEGIIRLIIEVQEKQSPGGNETQPDVSAD